MHGITLKRSLALSLSLLLGGGCRTVSSSEGYSEQTEKNASDFVKVSGTKFTLNGKPFYFQGSNFYRVAMDKQFSEAELDDIFARYANNGLKVVRFWAFSCDTKKDWGIKRGFHSQGKALLDATGKVSEEAFVQIDKTIAAAGRHGIKIILPLVNFEHEYCGMEWWNYVYGDKKESKHAFYCNKNVIDAFRTHVRRVLTRKNTVHGRTYSEDPNIMAIELANEPHTKDHYETDGKVDPSCQDKVDSSKPGNLVYNWLQDTAAFVKGIDRNHLVATGEEGYKASGDQSKHSWLHSGSKGVAFEKNVTLKDIDFATVHLYPDNSEIPKDDFDSWYVENVIKDRARISHSVGKPIVMEETGFSEFRNDGSAGMNKYKRMGYYDDRPGWLRKMYKAANEADYAGTMIWQAVPTRPDGRPYDDDDFTFPLSSEEGKVVREQAAYMNAKNN